MTPERLKSDVLNLIDAHSSTLTKEQYHSFLTDLSFELDTRADAVEDEIATEPESTNSESEEQ